MKNLNVAVLYGGTNTEHEISIITALQVMQALKAAGYTVLPVYITKTGSWILGNQKLLDPASYRNLNQVSREGGAVHLSPAGSSQALVIKNFIGQTKPGGPVDVAFPVFHGKYGEDGAIHGLLKLLNLPIAGSAMLPASLGMDKHLSKLIAKSLNLPVVDDCFINLAAWQESPAHVVSQVETVLSYPVIIKPSALGSSIGIQIAQNRKVLMSALEVAFTLDSRVLVEKLLKKPLEVQISVLGNNPYEVSVTEQPIKSKSLLSYEDKYVRGQKKTGASKGMASASRLIPAPISQKQTKTIQDYALRFFEAIGGQGLSRIDFLIQGNIVYFNEINTIPGSLAFYLWEKSGKPFPQLVDGLVHLALEAYSQESALVKTFETNILANFTLPGKSK